jgi:hypothetical protein
MPIWQFPQGGLNRAVGKQRQPPFTTPDAQNALPESPQDGRIRGGVRPGQVRTWYTSSSSPIRLLDSVIVKLPGSNRWSWRDTFDYPSFPSSWTTSNNCVGLTSTAPTLSRSSIVASTLNTLTAIRRAAPSDHKATLTDGTDYYRIGMYIRPYQNAHHGEYSIFFRLDASPDVTADATAMELRFSITGTGTISARLYKQNVAQGVAAYTDTHLFCTEGWLDVVVTKGASNDTIDVYWRGVLIIQNAACGTVAASSGLGFGFGMKPTVAGGRCIVDRVRYDYPAAAAKEQLRPITFFIQDGKLYHDRKLAGFFEQAGTRAPFAADRQLQCANLGQYVYFADHSDPLFTGNDGNISGGNTFSSATDHPDLITNGLSSTETDNNYFGHYAVHITSPEDKAGVYAISGLTNGSPDTLTIYKNVTSALAPGSGGATNGGPPTSPLHFRIERIAKFWDPSTDTVSPWVSVEDGGTVPCGCRAIEADGARLHLAADPLDPNQVYGSAIGEPHNWQFSDVEAGSAFELGGPDAGKPGDAVTAIMFWKDDIKLIGCRSECWIVRGAPPDGGGGAEVVSRHAGALSFSAYCAGDQGELYWLGRNGVFLASPQCMACEPESLSKIPLPRELQDLDAASLSVLAAYDRRSRGVLFCLTPNEPVSIVRNWFYYVPTKAFFPVVFGDAAAYPTAMKWLEAVDPEDSALYFGGFTGSIRRFSATAQNDDTAAIDSYVDIGPIALGNEFWDAAVATLRPILGLDSGDVTYQVFFGATMEEAMEATMPFATGTFVAGNTFERPVRGSGGAVRLRLIGTAGQQWSLERIAAAIETLQRAR